MSPTPSPFKKGFLRFLSLFNTITGPIIGIVFIIFIFQDIPLKYLSGFIILYGITQLLSLILDTKKSFPIAKKQTNNTTTHIFSFVGINIGILIFLTLLISRYQLQDYRIWIYTITIVVTNILFVEYIFHIFRRLLTTASGVWFIRTFFLLTFVGISIYGINNLRYSGKPLANTSPKKTTSEVTGVISTIDPNIREISPGPWDAQDRGLGIGDTGDDVKRIQSYLKKELYYTGEISGKYDLATAEAINTFLKEMTGETFSRSEFGKLKLIALKSIPVALPMGDSTTIAQVGTGGVPQPLVITPQKSEASGTLTTESKPNNITIDSITSLDGKATAVVKDGKITIHVINPEGTKPTTPTPISPIQSGTTTTNTTTTPTSVSTPASTTWSIRASLSSGAGGGGLRGVVISAPIALPRSGTYQSYETIILSAEGSSGIFFTIDGSDPSCTGQGSTELSTSVSSFTLKAISCFGGNRVRGPIASYTYTLGR